MNPTIKKIGKQIIHDTITTTKYLINQLTDNTQTCRICGKQFKPKQPNYKLCPNCYYKTRNNWRQKQ